MDSSAKAEASPDTRFRIALGTIVLAFAWWIVDLNAASTLLVTPVNSTLHWSVWLTGAAIGAWACLTVFNHLISRKLTAPDKRVRNTIWVGSAVGLLFGGLIAEQAMWRAANIFQFWNSKTPIVTTAFPIRSVRHRGSGSQVSIGSNGQRDILPISRRDSEMMKGWDVTHPPWQFCLRLRRQAEGQAVRIWRPSRPRLGFSGTTIIPCPAQLRGIR